MISIRATLDTTSQGKGTKEETTQQTNKNLNSLGRTRSRHVVLPKTTLMISSVSFRIAKINI